MEENPKNDFPFKIENVPEDQKDEAAKFMVSKMMLIFDKTINKFRLADELNKKLCKTIDADLIQAKEVIKECAPILGDFWSIQRLKEDVEELDKEYQYMKKNM